MRVSNSHRRSDNDFCPAMSDTTNGQQNKIKEDFPMKKIFAFILSIVSVFSVMCIAPSSSIKADAATYYIVCPADGDYQIAPKNNSNYAIDVVGGVFSEWQPIHLYSRSTTNTAQIWTLERQGSSYWYRIKNTASGLSLNVRCGEDRNDARLMLYSSSDTSNASYFRFVSCKGSFIIQSKLSNGRVIDLDNGICFNQAIVHLWSAHDGNSALWNLYNYNNSKKTAYVNTSSGNLYLRSLPGNGSVIASMPKGSTITVLDNCTDFSGFYRVQYGSKIGFASKSYISFTQSQNYISNSNDFIKESSLIAAASTYGISTNSNAYAALKLINTKYARNLSQNDKKGTLVFMFEGVGNSSSTSKRENAMCVVVKNGNIVYINRYSSSIPDYPFSPSKNGGDPMPTLKSGIYNFSTVNHRSQYAALRVQNANVVRFRSSSNWYGSTSSAINIHRKSSDNIASFNAGWVNSAGCQLIGQTGTSNSSDYTKFIKSVGIVNSNASGNSKYNYSVNGKYILDRTYAHDYMRNIGYSENAIKAIG